MIAFLSELRSRNSTLYWYGWLCLVSAISFLTLTQLSEVQVMGISAWFKPFKFALSTFFYAWAIAWYCFYLRDTRWFNQTYINWLVIVMLTFEIVYIATQASRGQLSHYNQSNSFYTALFALMAFAATVVVLATAYVGTLFWIGSFPQLPNHYLWGIRFGILIFVVFSFEGFVMGSRLAHTIGAPDGGRGLPILNWSTKYGDPRVAHFVGMHALQIVPWVSFYVLKSRWKSIGFAIGYGFFALFTFLQALAGVSFFGGSL